MDVGRRSLPWALIAVWLVILPWRVLGAPKSLYESLDESGRWVGTETLLLDREGSGVVTQERRGDYEFSRMRDGSWEVGSGFCGKTGCHRSASRYSFEGGKLRIRIGSQETVARVLVDSARTLSYAARFPLQGKTYDFTVHEQRIGDTFFRSETMRLGETLVSSTFFKGKRERR